MGFTSKRYYRQFRALSTITDRFVISSSYCHVMPLAGYCNGWAVSSYGQETHSQKCYEFQVGPKNYSFHVQNQCRYIMNCITMSYFPLRSRVYTLFLIYYSFKFIEVNRLHTFLQGKALHSRNTFVKLVNGTKYNSTFQWVDVPGLVHSLCGSPLLTRMQYFLRVPVSPAQGVGSFV